MASKMLLHDNVPADGKLCQKTGRPRKTKGFLTDVVLLMAQETFMVHYNSSIHVLRSNSTIMQHYAQV